MVRAEGICTFTAVKTGLLQNLGLTLAQHTHLFEVIFVTLLFSV